jgi:hypothetical protein
VVEVPPGEESDGDVWLEIRLDLRSVSVLRFLPSPRAGSFSPLDGLARLVLASESRGSAVTELRRRGVFND